MKIQITTLLSLLAMTNATSIWKSLLDDEFFSEPLSFPSISTANSALEYSETKDGLWVHFSVPGFSPNDLQLSYETKEPKLILEAKHTCPQTEQKSYCREKEMKKVVQLMYKRFDLDMDNIKSVYENGELHVHVPKSELQKNENKKVKIEIGDETGQLKNDQVLIEQLE